MGYLFHQFIESNGAPNVDKIYITHGYIPPGNPRDQNIWSPHKKYLIVFTSHIFYAVTKTSFTTGFPFAYWSLFGVIVISCSHEVRLIHPGSSRRPGYERVIIKTIIYGGPPGNLWNHPVTKTVQEPVVTRKRTGLFHRERRLGLSEECNKIKKRIN